MLALGFTSCNQGDFPDYSPKPSPQEEEAPGNYTATFKALNSSLTGKISGIATLWVKGNQFYIKIYLSEGPRNIRVEQHIQREDSCDFRENAIGMRLIPLDGNLRSQLAGLREPYTMSSEGTFYYSKSTFYNEMIRDLRMTDPNLNDAFGKLGTGEGLDLDRRIIVIYGSYKRKFVPIACGVIETDYSSPI